MFCLLRNIVSFTSHNDWLCPGVYHDINPKVFSARSSLLFKKNDLFLSVSCLKFEIPRELQYIMIYLHMQCRFRRGYNDVYIFIHRKKKNQYCICIYFITEIKKKEILKCRMINGLLFFFFGGGGGSKYFHSQKISILIWLLWWLQRKKTEVWNLLYVRRWRFSPLPLYHLNARKQHKAIKYFI